MLGDAIKYREGCFDKVLIDAPCSGLGVLRRHPDGRWNKKEETVRERATVQREILEELRLPAETRRYARVRHLHHRA